jgi:nonsense-mediated mRNA decay protein 3
MKPNPANICAKCLCAKEDITLGLFKKVTLMHCPECKSYFQPPNTWIKLQFDSKELLAFCLKKLEKNMKSKNVRLVNAVTVPTEPNSKRIKVKVYVQKEVMNGSIVECSYDVEFVQHNRMCGACTKVFANPDQWVSVVQLRQHVSHMRTFLKLEQAILKHGVASNALRIKQMKQGMDFFFTKESYARKFLDFIKGQVPVNICDSKQLVSHDTKSNDYSYRYTFSVEICPVCREDLVFLPPKVYSSLGNIGPIVICTKVTNVIALFDPITSTRFFLAGDMYWRAPFKSLLTRNELVEYIVLDVEGVYSEVTIDGKKFGLANAEVARVKDWGKNDTRLNIKTHLGYLLQTGDYALGYDLCGVNNSDNEIELDEYVGGGAILIKKKYEEKCQKRHRKPPPYLKDLEEMPDMMIGLSLGGEEVLSDPLYEQMGGLHLNDEEYEAKRRR